MSPAVVEEPPPSPAALDRRHAHDTGTRWLRLRERARAADEWGGAGGATCEGRVGGHDRGMKILFRDSGIGLRLAAAGLLLLLTACSTPAARIRRNQALFDSLPVAEQALIREGKVGLGFSPEMVRLAVGDPDQRWIRTDRQGRAEVWSYTTYDGFDGVPLYRGYYHRYHGGYPFFYDGLYRDSARPREYFKVTFESGKVTAVEQASR